MSTYRTVCLWTTRKTLLRDGLEPHVLKNLSLMHVQGSCVNLDDLAQVHSNNKNHDCFRRATVQWDMQLGSGICIKGRCAMRMNFKMSLLAKYITHVCVRGPFQNQEFRVSHAVWEHSSDSPQNI